MGFPALENLAIVPQKTTAAYADIGLVLSFPKSQAYFCPALM